ncbi:ATP-binding protein [Patescibacteria group bacterium]|nr:ATP-binding protein [Patescibacteria group bacterium]MBU4338246.1 ATP-binding protein [Patescibacteria group bacterium]MBU4580358.1 ATP-binding protein [Patescibacteria group bacterium]
MYIHRALEKQIFPFLKRKEALSIIGPRQAGKTTFIGFIKETLEKQNRKVKFITFENKADLDLFNNNIEDFKAIATQYDCFIIDEFQYSTDGGQKLKYLYDTTKIKFIISGSSSLELTFQTDKYMVGRLLEFMLPPFSFREFLSYKNIELYNLLENRNIAEIINFDFKNIFGEEINKRMIILLEEYLLFGGYPAVVLTESKEEKHKVLESIAGKYLLKDIQGVLRLKTDNELWRLEKFLAGQIGNMIKYEELSKVTGLSLKDLKTHLNILEKTYIVSFISPFFRNKRTELTKNPKVYFFDLGIRNFALNDFRVLADRNDLGAMAENYAYNALTRRYYPVAMKYWRTKSKAEVDFILEKDQAIYPFEVKYSSKKIIGKSLYSFINKFNSSAAVIFTKDLSGEEKIGEMVLKFIPLIYL